MWCDRRGFTGDCIVSRLFETHRPLEVKSGKNATHRSLDKFVEKFPDYVYAPTILWTKDRKEKAGVIYLPIYMAPCLIEDEDVYRRKTSIEED